MTWTTHDRETDHHGTERDSVVTIDGDLPYSYGDDGTLLHAALSAIADTLGMILFGTDDPTSGAGVAHRMPAIYLRNNSGTVEIWTPTGAGATAWQQVTIP
jgi:hypothetical protein